MVNFASKVDPGQHASHATITVYTDGSFKAGGGDKPGRSGAVVMRDDKVQARLSVRLPDDTPPFLCEAFAMGYGARNLGRVEKDESVKFFTYCHVVLNTLGYKTTLNKVVLEASKAWRPCVPVEQVWSWHTPGNEAADKLAKRGRNLDDITPLEKM